MRGWATELKQLVTGREEEEEEEEEETTTVTPGKSLCRPKCSGSSPLMCVCEVINCESVAQGP